MKDVAEIIETASGALASKPILGGGASIGTGALSFISGVMPYLQFISILIGITIGLLTLYGMLEKKFKK